MTDKEKLIKIKSLADKMSDTAFNMTTDASLLKKAMDEYHQFIINEYHKEEQVIKKLQKEPVSEDLIDVAKQHVKEHVIGIDKVTFSIATDMFISGAKWQKEQFEKNRLKHCNSITNEQAELEQGFIDQHLDKHQRMPTFLDAIEYGMRLQKEQLMAKAVDGVITFDYYGKDDKTYGCIAHDSFCLEDIGLKDTDKVKMIVVKDEMSVC